MEIEKRMNDRELSEVNKKKNKEFKKKEIQFEF
jgi:hypothetical protein